MYGSCNGMAVNIGRTVKSEAERRVQHALIMLADQDDLRTYPNVRWISKPSDDMPARDGETDLVVVHPENGLLIIEVKGGQIRRDSQGRWWSGEHRLKPPPFEQAERSKHALREKLASLPDWPGDPQDIRMGHAVAFPHVAVAGCPIPSPWAPTRRSSW